MNGEFIWYFFVIWLFFNRCYVIFDKKSKYDRDFIFIYDLFLKFILKFVEKESSENILFYSICIIRL